MNSIKKNFVYNLLFQILSLIIPLITAPYLSRVLGSHGVGVYSYTYSVVYYFMILCLLGVNNYGNRTIAKVREDKEKLSKTFWSIYYFQLIMGFLMLVLYFCYIYLFDIKYKTISYIQSLFIISSILDINWFFFGLEEFKKTITRNIIVKVANAILIFVVVKNSNDIWKYTIIMSGMTCLSQLVLWSFLKKYIVFKKVKWNDIKKHIKPNLVLFIPVIAVSIYKIMDKIMIGIMCNVSEVGYYENAERIINVPITIIIALGTVMLPRISNIAAKGDKTQIVNYMKKSISFMVFSSLPMAFGLASIAEEFAPIFYGSEFYKTGPLLIVLSLAIPFQAISNVVRTQYLIPCEKDQNYVVSVFIGAIINLIINLIAIPPFGALGASFGTIVSEFFVMTYQILSIKKEINIMSMIMSNYSFIVKSVIMLLILYFFNYIGFIGLSNIIMKMIVGVLTYTLLNSKYMIEIIKSILFRKKVEK